MSNRNMTVSVLVNLVDRMTGPLNRLRGGIDRLADAGRRIGAIGVIAAGISFAAPIQQAAAFDSVIRDTAITAGRTGAAVEKFIGGAGAQYEKLALKVGQNSLALAGAAQLLVSAGMDDGLITKLMPTIGKVATAAKAELNDTAKTAFSLSDALKIPAEQMELALAKLVTAGKLGRFEFKNMATEFPELTAQVAKLGVTGMEAVDFLGAALQTAMKGTNNPATAANNLKNFLSKIAAPDAIKNFKEELGVDIVGVMTNATAKGINPIEAVMEKLTSKLAVPKAEIDKILKDAKAKGMTDKDAEAALRARIQQLLQGTKLGKIYADMQVQDFLIPFMIDKAGFKANKEAIRSATTGVIDDDFASRMRSLEQDLKRFGEVGSQALRRVGMAFASNLPLANTALQGLLNGVASIDGRFPGLIDKMLSFGGAALVAGAALAILAPVFGALGAAIGLLVSPIGLVAIGITSLVAAGAWLYANWSTVWPQISMLASNAVQAIVAAMVGLGARLQELGASAIQGLWDGMKSRFEALVGWLTAQIDRVRSLFLSLGSMGNAVGAGGAPQGGINTAPGGGAGSPDANVPRPGSGGFSASPGKQSSIGGSEGFAPRERAASNETKVGGRIVVSAAPGTTIRDIQSDNAMIPITPDRGAMLSRA